MTQLATLRRMLERQGYANIRVRRVGTALFFAVDDRDERSIAFLRRLETALRSKGHSCTLENEKRGKRRPPR
jgi:hypothetical protein